MPQSRRDLRGGPQVSRAGAATVYSEGMGAFLSGHYAKSRKFGENTMEKQPSVIKPSEHL